MDALAPGVAEKTMELHDAVSEYVEYLKNERLEAPEAVVRIKQAPAQAGLEIRGHAADMFVESAVTLCIEEFYKE